MRVRGKTGGRLVPIPDTYERLQAFIKHQRPGTASDRVFVSKLEPYAPLTEWGVYQFVKDVAARTGWKRRIYPHLLRHSAIARMGAARMNPAYTSEITGASIEVIVRTYMHPQGRGPV